MMNSKVQVITGRLEAPNQVLAETGETVRFQDMSQRARWAWLRFAMGQREADEAIRSILPEKPTWLQKESAFNKVWNENAPAHIGQGAKTLQYILKDEQVYTVASTRHLVVPPEQVLQIAKGIVPDLKAGQGFTGVVKELEELPGLKVGFQFDPGDIFTVRAIGVGFAIRVITCTNPLSFLGAGNLTGLMGSSAGGINALYEKIERFQTKIELEAKIKRAIEGVGPKSEILKEQVNLAKTHPITESEADTILTAFPHAYSAGKATVKQIKERYAKEDKTLWGMAQATSYVARHGEFGKGAKSLDVYLATAGAAMIFIREPRDVADICKKWLSEVKKVDLNEWR